MSNKITTLGYFVKRLRDSGYVVNKLYTDFSEMDSRRWTVVIDPDNASVFCTCYENDSELGDLFFEMYDGGRFIPSKFRLKTDSIEVIVTYLNKYGIHNKARDYVKPKSETG